uniref:SfiI-subtelomeric related protein family member, putative n=1 Tax=Theileria annulata TaxID=5874 RepID=A0A3B0N2T2_THEAN
MFPQVVQAPYPKYLAILRNGKPYVIRKNSLSEPWYNITHLRYDIEKLLFTDSNNKDYNYLQCSVELYELILVIEFGFNCKKVWFDGKLCWTLTNSQEYPKFLGLHLRTNQIFLMFSKLRLELLDVENPKVEEGEIEGKVTGKRPVQFDWVRNNKYTKMSNSTNPFRPIIDPTKLVDTNPFSKSLRRRFIREAELMSEKELSRSCPKQHQTTLENDEADKVTKIDVIGKSYKNIAKLLHENNSNVIECNGYDLCPYGDNVLYKLNESASRDNLNSASTNFRKENPKKLPPKSIVHYKKEKMVVFETSNKYIVYRLEETEWVEKCYEIPPITLYFRVELREFAQLSPDQYTVGLRVVEGIKFVYRVRKDINCSRVMLGNRTVWACHISMKCFIKTLIYSVVDDSIVLDGNLLIKCTKVDNKWIGISQHPYLVRHYAEDGLGDFIPVYIDRVSKNYRFLKYTLDYKDVPKIDLVKYHEKTIWRREPEQSVPKSMTCRVNESKKTFVFKFQDKFIVYRLKGNDLTYNTYDIPPIKLLSQDNQGHIIPLNSNNYSVQLSLNLAVIFIYTFVDVAVCTQVEYGERIIWKYKRGQNKPLCVVYSRSSQRIQVIFKDKIVLADLKNPNSIPSSLKIPPEISLYKTNEQGETVRLDVRDYRVQLYKSKGFRYVVNEEVTCTELRHNGTVVWRYTGGILPLSFVYFFKGNKTISVAYKTGTCSYQLELGQWVPTETTNTN